MTRSARTPSWASSGDGQVTRIDPDTGKDELFAENYGTASSIAVDGDAVWLGGGDGVVTKLDRDGYELESTQVQVLGSATTSIAVDREAVWFVGDSSTPVAIDPLTVSILDSFEIGASPSTVAVAEDGAVWVAGGSATSLWRVDKTKHPRDDPARRDLGRPRRRLWQDLDEPRNIRRVAPDAFALPTGALPSGDGPRTSGCRCWPSVQVSPCSCRPPCRARPGRARRPRSPVRTASRRAAVRSGSCGAQSPLTRPCHRRPCRVGDPAERDLREALQRRLRPGHRQGAGRSRGRAEHHPLGRRPHVHFELKRTFRFDTGERVTAQSFADAFNRNANKKLGSPAARRRSSGPTQPWGTAKTVSGVEPLGDYRLRIRLMRPAGDLVARLTMPYFCPIPRDAAAADQCSGWVGAVPRRSARLRPAHRPRTESLLPRWATASPDRIVWAIESDIPEKVRATEQGENDFTALFAWPDVVIRGLVAASAA